MNKSVVFIFDHLPVPLSICCVWLSICIDISTQIKLVKQGPSRSRHPRSPPHNSTPMLDISIFAHTWYTRSANLVATPINWLKGTSVHTCERCSGRSRGKLIAVRGKVCTNCLITVVKLQRVCIAAGSASAQITGLTGPQHPS